MEPLPAVDTLLKYAQDSGFTLLNKNPRRAKTTYICSKARLGCKYTCQVLNG